MIPSRGPCHSLQLAFPYLDSDNFKKRLKKKKKKPLWSWVGDGSVSRVKGEEGPELDTKNPHMKPEDGVHCNLNSGKMETHGTLGLATSHFSLSNELQVNGKFFL